MTALVRQEGSARRTMRMERDEDRDGDRKEETREQGPHGISVLHTPMP